MMQNTRKANNPIIRNERASSRGADSVKWRAMGAEMLSAAAVPKRAIANWMPIARASSWPVNQRTIAFDTVIPVISYPTPKMANPSDAQATDACKLKTVPSGAALTA